MDRSSYTTDDARFTFAARAAKVNSIGTLEGYALVWDVLTSDIRKEGRHRLAKGAAKYAQDVQAIWNHDDSQILGSMQAGTLRLYSDDTGVKVEIDLPDTQAGRDALTLIKRKDVRGMSFGTPAATVKGRKSIEAGQQVFTLESFLLDEVTITGKPAFTQTSVGVKADLRVAAARTAEVLQYARHRHHLFGLVRPANANGV